MFCFLAHDLSAHPVLKHEQPLEVNKLNAVCANRQHAPFLSLYSCCLFFLRPKYRWLNEKVTRQVIPNTFKLITADVFFFLFFFSIFIQDVGNAGADWNSFAHRCLFLLCCGLWHCNNAQVSFLVGWRSTCGIVFPVNLDSKKVTPTSVVRSPFCVRPSLFVCCCIVGSLGKEESLHNVNCCNTFFFCYFAVFF